MGCAPSKPNQANDPSGKPAVARNGDSQEAQGGPTTEEKELSQIEAALPKIDSALATCRDENSLRELKTQLAGLETKAKELQAASGSGAPKDRLQQVFAWSAKLSQKIDAKVKLAQESRELEAMVQGLTKPAPSQVSPQAAAPVAAPQAAPQDPGADVKEPVVCREPAPKAIVGSKSRLSIASDESITRLEKTNRQLQRIELRVEEIGNALLPGGQKGSLLELKTELAQLESEAKQLESGVDDVYTGELHTGKQLVKDSKRDMLRRFEALYDRVDKLFAEIKNSV